MHCIALAWDPAGAPELSGSFVHPMPPNLKSVGAFHFMS